MNEMQSFWVGYAALLQRLSRPSYSLGLQIDCEVPEDEDAQMQQRASGPLKTSVKLISARCDWDGQIACIIRLSDLPTNYSQFLPLTKFLTPTSLHLAVLGEAVVHSHRDDFLHFIDTFEQAAWRKACLAAGACQLQQGATPEAGPHLVITLPARFVANAMRAAESRPATAFPYHVQLSRFASMLLRLARGRYPVMLAATILKNNNPPSTTTDWAGDGMDDGTRWQGDVNVIINQPDLGVTISSLRSFRPLLDEHREFTDWFGDAILAARVGDFEAYVAGLAPDDWEYAALAHRHRHWGLKMYPASNGKPYQLAFLFHVSRIAVVLNDRLLQAATEGAR